MILNTPLRKHIYRSSDPRPRERMVKRLDKAALRDVLKTHQGEAVVYSLRRLEGVLGAGVRELPFTIKVLLENAVRNLDHRVVEEEHVEAVAEWPGSVGENFPFMPSRVLLQDYTGVPLIVDLAAMRSAVRKMGGDPSKINPIIPADLVIDHSIQVDYFGTPYALQLNMEREYERNRERYQLLKWSQRAFRNLRVFPPGKGICHQVNLEYLSRVVDLRLRDGALTAFPDTLIGTDSHTTMVNGIGVLGWGVGGIEAEVVMLGQPYYIAIPEVIGVRLVGELREGATATDIVLTVTETLRRRGVVGKFVEFFGPSLSKLSAPDRATLGNMSPEYGATCGFFPIDDSTIAYLSLTSRPQEHVELVERYARLQGLFYDHSSGNPRYSEVVELDLSAVEPSIAGPRNPEERIPLREARRIIGEIIENHKKSRGGAVVTAGHDDVSRWVTEGGSQPAEEERGEDHASRTAERGREGLSDGAVVIASITSCTNTSNPTVMIGAGLLARKAVKRGLSVPSYVKTSMSPGSTVVTDYLSSSGLLRYLESLGFHVVGYGCMTCIGNSGPLASSEVESAVRERGLFTAAVLSGNRNFEGRINPSVRGAFLASPMLVVVYALAGRIDIDFYSEPLGRDPDGRPVYLRDIWPTLDEVRRAVESAVRPELFARRYADPLKGDERWDSLPAPEADSYEWSPDSTYIREPPWFDGFGLEPRVVGDIEGARVLALLGDRVTTDHISPAGVIPPDSPAGRYLLGLGVEARNLHTYGARRGNHEVMVRGGFSNIRLRNALAEGREGGFTKHLPSGEILPIYDAATRYREEGVPLIVLAGKQYGAGSSRDWAAKATALLGVKAVIAESFERIHRSNLIAMGVLPLEFKEGESWRSLGLDGTEEYDIKGISSGLRPRQRLSVIARRGDGGIKQFEVTARLDTAIEVEYYLHGGVLPYVLRRVLRGEEPRVS